MVVKIGNVVKTKALADKVIYRVELTEKEALQLKNHVTNVRLFAAELCDSDTKIIERGAKKGAKYFAIPLDLKSRKKKRYSKVSYQKIETGERIFFVCVVDKDPLFD